MLMISAKRTLGYIVLVMILIIIPLYGYSASWSSMEVLIIGTWGSNSNQFGLQKGDTVAYDIYPEIVIPITSEKILINDEVNNRGLAYSISGQFLEIVLMQKTIEGQYEVFKWSKYYYDGIFLGFDQNNSFWTMNGGAYRKYDVNYNFLQTITTRPLALGRLKVKQLSLSQWRYEVEYPDGIYRYEGPRDAFNEQGLMKVNANLIMQNQKTKVTAFTVSAEIPVQPNEKKKYQLAVVAEWTKPSDEFGPVQIAGVERLPTLVAQYGDAVIGPDGSIYTWMRTAANYKILKWQWVE